MMGGECNVLGPMSYRGRETGMAASILMREWCARGYVREDMCERMVYVEE